MRTLRSPSPRRAKGFVLPVTVMLLALVAAGVALMSHRSDHLRALATASKEEAQASISAQRALAQAEYLVSILYRRGATMGEIQLDGRFYRTADGALVSFQDAAGLFDLRRAPKIELERLLAALGIANTSRLADTLLDYVDADDLVRAEGAEASDYAGTGLPPPRNERLLTPTELERIPGWHELDDEQRRLVIANVHVGFTRTVNRNTVTAAALSAVTGLDPAQARELVAQRAAGTPLNIESILSSTGASFLAMARFATLPSVTTLVTICPRAVAWCDHVSLTTSAESAEGPWHVEYSYRMPAPPELPVAAKVSTLPDQVPEAPPPLFNPLGLPKP